MLNVNQITSQLAKMPDNALQQYATMHKADPYMLALTVAESNRRKQLRSAAQGAQGAAQQPKVADQAIAGMSPQQLPENVGIGALPADNMKGMAGGGIVAFEEGGQVPRFQNRGIVYAQPGYEMPSEAELAEYNRQQGLGFWDNLKELMPSFEAEQLKPQPKKNTRPDINAERDKNMALVNAQGYTRPGMQSDPRLPAGYKPDTQAKATPAAERSGIAAGIGGAGTYKPSTLADMMKEVSPEVEKMNAEDRKAMDPFRTQFETERSDLAKRKETNKGEALLAAGLGMMAGNSRHALQNIGTGAQQGLASLKDATRADDAAKRALMQSEMHLAQAEMQGRKGNFQSMNQLANQARQEKQFATSSELQKQQIANQGAYYGAMGEAAKARGGMEAKMLSEYRRLQELAEKHVKENGQLLTDAQRSALYQTKLNEYIATNPFMSKLGGQQSAEPLTREL